MTIFLVLQSSKLLFLALLKVLLLVLLICFRKNVPILVHKNVFNMTIVYQGINQMFSFSFGSPEVTAADISTDSIAFSSNSK